MKVISKVAIAFAVIMSVFAIASDQSVDAVPLPEDGVYVVGPFEAVAYGTTEANARGNAWFEIFDQFYGPGGHSEMFIAQALTVLSLDIVTEGFDSPEYRIVYTITVTGPSQPIGLPGDFQ